MPEIIFEDTVGCHTRKGGSLLAECMSIPEPLKDSLLKKMGLGCRLTPIQEKAILAGICNPSKHFLVSAPTNSGKTLVGIFRIFTDILKKRGRCVYVAPLKALAEEKRIEFEALCQEIIECNGPEIKLSITTGDYQLTRDFLGSPPPENGELVICTPERLEIMLRSNKNLFWARAVSTFLFDEFHLLGDGKRGAALEILLTRILVSCPWSRIVGLSATIGGLEAIKKWMEKAGTPVQILDDQWRYPPLHRRIVATEDKNKLIHEKIQQVLEDNDRSLIVFVSKKTDAENLVKEMQQQFGRHKKNITCLHAGLTLKERHERLMALRTKEKRIIFATTALKMGIDAPVTNVVVRDTLLWGEQGAKHLTYADLLQMMGRAGRRNIPGEAIVLCDPDKGYAMLQQFQSDALEPIRPQLIQIGQNQKNHINPILGVLLTEVVMKGKITISQLNDYIIHTFSCADYDSIDTRKEVNELIRLKLVYREENHSDLIFPSKLGKTLSQTGLSPESGALLAVFLRALIKLDDQYEEKKGRRFNYLRRLTDLDLIFLCCACFECRSSLLKPPGKKTISDVQEYIETLPFDEKPVINLWNSEESTEYPTRRLLTTLRFPLDVQKKGNVEKTFYRILQSAVLLNQHAKGVHLADLAKKFKKPLGELENNLKFNVLWMLNCLSQICNSKRCYKMDFLMMRSIKLIECISVGSELGTLLTQKGVGRRTIDIFLENGLNSLEAVKEMHEDSLRKIGVGKKQAKAIWQYFNRFSR
jgi:helicase